MNGSGAIDLVWHTAEHTIPTAYSLLPGRMASPNATAQILAIGLQESGFKHRRQVGGTARGLYQFEQRGGVADVLDHPLTHSIIVPICDLLLYPATSAACYAAIEYDDVLATVFARLQLWIDPRVLANADDSLKGWAIYLAQWRPGKPRPKEWPGNFEHAWHVVTEMGAIAA